MFSQPRPLWWFPTAAPLLACLLVLVGCQRSEQEVSPTDGLDATVTPTLDVTPPRLVSPTCRPDLAREGADAIGVLELAVTALADAVDAPGPVVGAECEVSRRPLCAALFLIGATDPIVGFGRGVAPADLARLVDLHDRVLDRAVTIAATAGQVELASSLVRLAALDTAGAVVRDDDTVAALVVARADPEIVGPISGAEADC